MPNTAEILNLAPAASYLAANQLSKGTLYDVRKISPILPQQIYALYFIINKIHSIDPNYPGLYAYANYLWEIMIPFGVRAQGIIGGGGSVPSPTPSNQGVYPFVITSADFESDGVSYNNPNIVGDNLELFPNQLNQQFWYAGQGFFVYTSSGIKIIYDGFNANTQSWTIRIDQVFGNGIPVTPPATENTLLIGGSFPLLINATTELTIN